MLPVPLRRAPRLTVALLALAAAPLCAQSAYEHLQTFSGLLSQIRLNYVDSVTTAQLVRGAITGMLGSLDPHSYFQAHDDALRMLAWRDGRLAGLGLIVEDVDGAVTVFSVLAGTPAARAGISPGDRLVALNDTSVAGQSAAQVQARLVGERGARVRLSLERGPRLEPETVSVRLRFDLVRPRSVTVAQPLAPGTGYVRLEQFLPDAPRELRDAIDRVVRGGRERRLILDLRGNPGGSIQSSVDIVSLFFPQNTLVYRVDGRRRDVRREFRTERNGEFRDVALIVLIDDRSASASEAVAASLQDHDRALVVGRRSFGKALMQMLLPVPPNDDAVWLTVGYLVSPSGRVIQRPYRGVSYQQYVSQSGGGAAAGEADTAKSFRTAGGRMVWGGGGVRPDTALPAPPALPAWFITAADSGYDHAVADSVAATLPGDAAARAVWLADTARWDAQLVAPFLERVRARLGVRATPDGALARRLGRILASRVAEVRWGVDARDEFRLRHDPDIAAAVALFPVLPTLLRPAAGR